MTKTLKISLLILFLFQILISASFELSHDESYYWLFSRHLDWGYFDHPPVMALVIRLFSFLPEGEWQVRFGFLCMQFGTLFVTWRLIPQEKKSLATFLFFAFPLASLSGLLALPDMPLLFATALYFLALKNYLEKDTFPHVLSLGVVIPFLLYSKYHGILLIFFTLMAKPDLLKRKSFYLITMIAILLFLPHIWWQYQHDFSTLRYHFIERPKAAFSLQRLVEYVGVQLLLAGVFAGPLVWWMVIKERTSDAFSGIMKFNCLGVVIFFFISSFSKKFEANWTIFLTVPLICLSVRSAWWDRKFFKLTLMMSLALVLFFRLVVFAGPYKRLAEVQGWKDWAWALNEKCGEGKKLMANNYQYASKLSYYLQQEIHALNLNSRKNQFDYWGFEKSYPSAGVCYVTDNFQFPGEQFLTPDGKVLNLVTDFSLSQLLALKSAKVP